VRERERLRPAQRASATAATVLAGGVARPRATKPEPLAALLRDPGAPGTAFRTDSSASCVRHSGSRHPDKIAPKRSTGCAPTPLTGYPLGGPGALLRDCSNSSGPVSAREPCVNLLEESVFQSHLLPWFSWAREGHRRAGPLGSPCAISWRATTGIITLGLRYAVAIILPIVGTFFLVFAVPGGQRVPAAAGAAGGPGLQADGSQRPRRDPDSCWASAATPWPPSSPAPWKPSGERLICTILLALAIPCSAQLGVITRACSRAAAPPWRSGRAWCSVIMLLTGWLAARLLPGAQPMFYMELPPLRLPALHATCWSRPTRGWSGISARSCPCSSWPACSSGWARSPISFQLHGAGDRSR
jgi:hypothetical protein